MEKRTMKIGIAIFAIVIATTLVSANLLSYYGKVEATVNVEQSIVFSTGEDWNDYDDPLSFVIDTAGGCTVAKSLWVRNQGCTKAVVSLDALKSISPGNTEGVTVFVKDVTHEKILGSAFVIAGQSTIHLEICYGFDSAFTPGTYTIKSEFIPGQIGMMVFDGTGDGNHAMVDESITGMPGDGEAGFDVYAKNGAMAMYATTSATTYEYGPVVNHDAYNTAGGWGSIYDPDCADWEHYQLYISGSTWAVRYVSGGTAYCAPISGTISGSYATETGAGAYYSGTGTAATTGFALDNTYTGVNTGAGAWDMDWSWGSEYIPLQYPGFEVIESGGYTILIPAPVPTTP